mmetsp:Transcript_131698/g.380921  ORF Transcript_131698/g.380921 Transcript_131698/m.380921 type:complete len:170 (+) Transcript_131698:193-702(+)
MILSLCGSVAQRRTASALLRGGTQTRCVATSQYHSFSTNAGGVQVHQAKQRKRRRANSRLQQAGDIPSYKEFVHRFTVLSLYRSFLKEIKMMPHNQDDLREQVQKEFKSSKTVTDPFNVQRGIAEGKRRLAELQEFTGSNNKYDGDSWLNTPDEEDKRGRVGTGWPWDR